MLNPLVLTQVSPKKALMSPPLRLLHIFGTFDHGGAEGRTVALMRGFGARATHAILVADQSAMGARKAIPADVAATFPVEPGRLVSGKPTPARLLRLARLLKGHDLILAYGWGAMDMVLAHRLFARALRLPPLVHHEDGLDPPRTGRAAWLRRTYRRIAMQGPDAIITPSRSLAGHAQQEWRVPPERLHILSNGVPMFSVPDRAPSAETHVVAIAGLRPEKNLRRLVRASAGAGSDIRLTLHGEGPERALIEAEAHTHGVAVALPGFTSDVPAALAQADIFALSSDTEQAPLSVMEAMAAGLPVVAPDVGDIKDMVAPENRAFIVTPASDQALATAIRALADDPALRARIGRANAAQARAHFDEAAMIAAYFALYTSVIPARTA
jgi:glycosyltransferase involved in cell wall biosynthesis